MGHVEEGREGATPAPDDPQVVALAAKREQRLLERARGGDRDALRDLLTPQADVLFSRVILPRTGDRAAAEDILKATMVTAIEKLDTFRWEGRSIYFWLRQIAANKVIDHHRRTQRGRKLADRLEREGELVSVAPSALPGPEASLIAREERSRNQQRISTALEAINPRYRKAIELRLIAELPREECARQLEVTVGTFDVLFFRAARAFRRVFGER
jgi:RNA polymerase sigma-70 factor (ECF subfamily)